MSNVTYKVLGPQSAGLPDGTTFKTTETAGVHTQHVNVDTTALPTDAATETKQDALLTELEKKADLTETQPISGTVTANLSATDNAVLDDAVLQLKAISPISSVVFDTILITYTDITKATISKVEWKLSGAVVKTLTPTFAALTDTWVRS